MFSSKQQLAKFIEWNPRFFNRLILGLGCLLSMNDVLQYSQRWGEASLTFEEMELFIISSVKEKMRL